jgi:hypothetical protein
MALGERKHQLGDRALRVSRIDHDNRSLDIKRGLDRAVRRATTALRKLSRPVKTRKEKAQVAAISAHNDPAIGELVADAMDKVGGVITVEKSKTTETVLWLNLPYSVQVLQLTHIKARAAPLQYFHFASWCRANGSMTKGLPMRSWQGESAIPKPKQASDDSAANREELRQILGEIDERKVLEILALRPTVEDLDQAAKWAAGEEEIVGKSGHPPACGPTEIFDILTTDEEEESPHYRSATLRRGAMTR